MDRDEYFRMQRERDDRARADADRLHNDRMAAQRQADNRAAQMRNDQIKADIQRQQQAHWDHDATLRAQYSRIEETNRAIARERSASVRHQLEDHRHAQINHYTNQVYGTNPHATTDPGRFPHELRSHSWWQVWKRK